MSRILLDAATIRAADMLSNPDNPPPPRSSSSDIDICALGQYLDALILFDDILVPDLGGKTNVKDACESLGNAVRIIPINDVKREIVEKESREWLQANMRVDDAVRSIGFSPHYSYIPSGSSRNLVLTALGASDKYGRLAEAIKDVWARDLRRRPKYRRESRSFEDERESFDLLYCDSQREPVISRSGVRQILREDGWLEPGKFGAVEGSADFIQFTTNLIWTAFRGRCYAQIGHALDSAYMPHPLRGSLLGYSMFLNASQDEVRRYSAIETYVDAMKAVYAEGRSVLSGRGVGAVPIHFSVMLPYLARRAMNRENLLEVAYSVREGRAAQSLRSHMSEIEHAATTGNLRELIKATKEVDTLTRTLRKSLGIAEGSDVTIAVTLGFAQIEKALRVPKMRAGTRLAEKPRIALLRNVFDDLTMVSTLGAAYEIIWPLS